MNMKKIKIVSNKRYEESKILLNVEDSVSNIKNAYDKALEDMEEEDFISLLDDPDEALILEWDNENS